MDLSSGDGTSFLRLSDDRGRLRRFATLPQRIVSLVPSDTYSLLRLGAGKRLVGRTRYCVAPSPEVETIEALGGTKDPDLARIVELAPDLVIMNQEENTKSAVLELEAAGLAVYVSFPQTVQEGLAHWARLGRMLGVGPSTPGPRALLAEAYHTHREALEALAKRSNEPPVRVFVPIWMDPLMTVHESTFISDMLALVGAQNVFSDRERRYPLAADRGEAAPLSAEKVGERDVRYPRVTLEEVVERQPELVLLPDEPHAFSEADAEVFRALAIPAARRGQVHLCDGRDLMWPGARSFEGIARLRAIVDGAR